MHLGVGIWSEVEDTTRNRQRAYRVESQKRSTAAAEMRRPLVREAIVSEAQTTSDVRSRRRSKVYFRERSTGARAFFVSSINFNH